MQNGVFIAGPPCWTLIFVWAFSLFIVVVNNTVINIFENEA